jgi:uncharacterized protein with HEPN domain
MDNNKKDTYYIEKILKDTVFLINHTKNLTRDNISENEVLLDSIMFRLVQISENTNCLSDEYKNKHNSIAWHDIKGMRNRIVHEYGEVDLSIIYDTVKTDIPMLYEFLKGQNK